MDEVCEIWGYCVSTKHGVDMHVTLIVPSEGEVTADQFVEWLLLADDVNPNSMTPNASKIKNGLRSAFVNHMGVREGRCQATFLCCDLAEKGLKSILAHAVLRILSAI